MTMLAPFELIRAASLAEVVAARRSRPDCRLLAGGTDLIANLRRGIGNARALVDITGLPGLQDIADGPAGIRIGAAVTLSRLADEAIVRERIPALAAAAAAVAGPTHRSSATLGGNLCLDTRCIFYNQSDWWRRANDFCLKHGGTTCHVAPTGKRCHAAYSGDTAPVLLVLGAAAVLGGPDGERRIPLDALFGDDGAAHLRLGPEEMLLWVDLPLQDGLTVAYAKTARRGAVDFPLAGVAVGLRRDGALLAGLRVAVTGTNSRPLLIEGCGALVGRPLDEEALQQLAKLIQRQVSPMRTTLAPAHYRRLVASALACRLAAALYAGRASPEEPAKSDGS